MFKKISVAALSMTMGLGLMACDDRDVAVTAGAVGGAIIASSVYDNYYGRDYRYSRGYYRDGRRYWVRYDGRHYYRRDNRWYRDRNHYRWDRGGRRWYRGRHLTTPEFQVTAINADSAPNRQAAVAGKYRISSGAANQVISAFETVRRHGNLEGFTRIGLLESDVQRIASGRSPSSASVQNMARTLGARTASVNALILDVKDEYSIYKQGTVTEE